MARVLRPLSRENDPNPWNPDCRAPTRYHIAVAGGTEDEVSDFLWGVVRALQPRAVVETGTADGDTTVRLGDAVRANGHGRVASIEVGEHRALRARERCKGLPVDVFVGDATTFDWSHWQPAAAREVDFAFLDGGASRHLEFARLRPYLAPKAWVAWHDMSNGLAVRASVDALVRDGVLMLPVFLPTPRGLAFGRLA